MHTKFLLIGYYGFQNAGDELLLKKSLSIIKDCAPNSKIRVLYNLNNIECSNKRYLSEVFLVNRFSIWQIICSIFWANTVVFGGGGILQDKTSFKSLVYYLGILFFSRLFNKNIVLLAQGLGPFNHTLSRSLMRYLKIDYISLRDKNSLAIWNKLGCKAKKVVLASDLAYYKAKNILKRDSNFKLTRTIGVSLRPLTIPNTIILAEFLNNLNLPVSFLAFQNNVDNARVIGLQSVSETYDMNNYFLDNKLLPKMPFLVIGMRFHACIWASLFSIPFLALGYDPKVIQLAKTLNQPYIDISDKKPDLIELKEKYNKLLADYELYKNYLLKKVPDLIDAAKQKDLLLENCIKKA